MKLYTGEWEYLWSVPGWVPVQRIPVVVYYYDAKDLVVDQPHTKMKGTQVSGQLVKGHPVTRQVQTHHSKKRRPKGGASIRRWQP